MTPRPIGGRHFLSKVKKEAKLSAAIIFFLSARKPSSCGVAWQLLLHEVEKIKRAMAEMREMSSRSIRTVIAENVQICGRASIKH